MLPCQIVQRKVKCVAGSHEWKEPPLVGEVVEHRHLSPVLRTDWRRFTPYLTAIVRAIFAALSPPEATAIRPPTSVPSIAKNRRDDEGIWLTYVPSSDTCANRANRFSRGIRTLSNQIRPLSRPLRPSLWPLSPNRMPGRAWPASSRRGTRKACTPCLCVPTTSWANTGVGARKQVFVAALAIVTAEGA